MKSRVLLLTITLVMTTVPPALARARSAYLDSGSGAAVDSKGVRYLGEKFPGRLTPWMVDRIKSIAPDYPYREQALRHEGVGYFKLILDLKTGSVTKVEIQKSTGFATLDGCAVAALRQWRWKPGKWKVIEERVRFVLPYSEPRLAPGSIPLPLRSTRKEDIVAVVYEFTLTPDGKAHDIKVSQAFWQKDHSDASRVFTDAEKARGASFIASYPYHPRPDQVGKKRYDFVLFDTKSREFNRGTGLH